MTPSTPVRDLATQWNSARRLYPIYFELAREFSIDVEAFAELETGIELPADEVVAKANQWLDRMDSLIKVHQLRQFLQTTSHVNPEGLVTLLQHFLAKPAKDELVRDKLDFLLVQYFSQSAPHGVSDAAVDLAFVSQALDPVLGRVEQKAPVWLNALDRVIESSRRCHSLHELLHSGILDQGRKVKDMAGDLFYMPVALVAFTRFGYLMRRAFFRLMLGDLNAILDGLNELEEKGVGTIDCRRAQFSAQEPIIRLRMICQSWKVMFQAEYSSGQPLRMLVDLRASVDCALGRGKDLDQAVQPGEEKDAATTPTVHSPEAENASTQIAEAEAHDSLSAESETLPAPAGPEAESSAQARPAAMAAAASAGFTSPVKSGANPQANAASKDTPEKTQTQEFEVSGEPAWNPDSQSE
jgi:hypothetical protein